MSVFSNNLKQKRLECGYSQKELAKKANIVERVYQSYEYGTVIPKLDSAVQLANALDCSLDWLSGRTVQPSSTVGTRRPFDGALNVIIAEHKKNSDK